MLQLSLSPSIIGSANARDSFNSTDSSTWAAEQVEIKSTRTNYGQFLSSWSVSCEKIVGIRGGADRNLLVFARGRTPNMFHETSAMI